MTQQTPKSKTCICNACALSLPLEMFYPVGATIRGRPFRRCRWCISMGLSENQRKVWLMRVLRMAKGRAAKRGMEFNITAEDLTLPELCPVLGIPLEYKASKDRFSSPSLDRIDNSLGYVKGNVVVVSYRANFIKSDAKLHELQKISEYYSKLVASA